MERNLSEKEESSRKIHAQYESVKKSYDEKNQELQKKSELLQALTTGVSAEEGHESGYMEQLQAAKNAVNEASTMEEQAKLKVAHLKKELREKEPQAAHAEKEDEGLLQELSVKRQELAETEGQLSTLHWNPERESDLTYRKTQERDTIMDLTDVKHTPLSFSRFS